MHIEKVEITRLTRRLDAKPCAIRSSGATDLRRGRRIAPKQTFHGL